jgi:hypothetical protein
VLGAGRLTASVDAPAASVGDAGEFLDVDVDQLSGPIALISDERICCCSVAGVEPADPFGDQDSLDGGAGTADLVTNVPRSPATLLTQLDDLAAALW